MEVLKLSIITLDTFDTSQDLGDLQLATRMMNSDLFFRQHVPSDLRFQRLFPENYEKIFRAKDLTAERVLLWYYQGWVDDSSSDPEVDEPRKEFYAGLSLVTFEDYMVVEQEVANLLSMAGQLAASESNNLEKDGKTTCIEKSSWKVVMRYSRS